MKKLQWVVAICISATVFIQGIYFNEQVMAAIIVSVVLLLGITFVNKSFKLPKTYSFYFFLFYFLSHMIGYITFVEKGMLVFGVARSVLYILAYLVIYQVYDETFHRIFGKVFVLSMMTSGLISVLSYFTGILEGRHLVIAGRLAGTVQYANTMAILLAVAVLLLLGLRLSLYQELIGLLLLLTPLFLTMSRAGAIMALFMIVGYSVTKRQRYATYLTIGTSIIVSGICVALLDQRGALARIGGTSIGASEFQTRLLYYKDSLAMISAHPFGYGFRGYYYAQRAFQTGSTYHAKFVHSGILQIVIELGIIAGIITMVFGAYVLLFKKMNWLNRWILIGMIGHSSLDVDLSYSLCWFLLIVFIQSQEDGDLCQKVLLSRQHKYRWSLATVISAVIIGGAIFFMALTLKYDQKAYESVLKLYPYHTEAIRKSLRGAIPTNESVERAQRAIEDNPYLVEAHEHMYNYYVGRQDYSNALKYSEALVELDCLQLSRYEVLAKTLRVTGQNAMSQQRYEEALEYFQEVLKMPVRIEELAKEKNTHYNVRHVPYFGMTLKLEKEYDIAKQWIIEIDKYKLEAIDE